MELKEYYKILKSNVSIIIYTVIIAVAAIYAWSVRAAQNYNTLLLLNVSRTEAQNTADYRYDQFYRLQADDKFSETIVEWLKSPGTVQDIFAKAGVSTDQKTMRQLSKSFRAEKLSANVVGVQYSAGTSDEAGKIAPAIESVVAEKIKNMNSDAKDPNWFEANMSDLTILKNTQDLRINLGIAALAGIFVGTLLAFGKHYISE